MRRSCEVVASQIHCPAGFISLPTEDLVCLVRDVAAAGLKPKPEVRARNAGVCWRVGCGERCAAACIAVSSWHQQHTAGAAHVTHHTRLLVPNRLLRPAP